MLKYPDLKFYINDEEGQFDWGKERHNLWERFYDIEEIEDPDTSIYELQKLINEDPIFIDAYNSLGWWEIYIMNYGNAIYYFDTALRIANKYIPKNFKGSIIWGILDNRPFLRMLHGIGFTNLLLSEWSKATSVFTKILKYNPHDNQGIRALIIQSLIAQGQFRKILKLCNDYSDDTMVDVLYGKALAHYRLDKLEKAKTALKNAIKLSPNVAKELLKKRHKPPTKDDGFLTVAGEDEAYDYWKRIGQYWTDIKLQKLIEEVIEPEPINHDHNNIINLTFTRGG